MQNFVPWLLVLFALLALLPIRLLFVSRKRHRELRQELSSLRKSVSASNKQLAQATKTLDQLSRRFDKERARAKEERTRAAAKDRVRFDALRDGQREVGLLQGLSGLQFQHPFFLTGWAIDGFLAHRIVEIIETRQPKTILELGSGTSSVLIQAAYKNLGLAPERHIAVDHLEEYLDETARRLKLQGFDGCTELWLCPLSEPASGEPPWYQGIVDRLGTTKIDLLVVDGPPGDLHPESRRPALPVLRSQLSPGATVLLDDAMREEEAATVEAWQNEFPELAVHISKRGKGFAELRVPDQQTAPETAS